MQGLVFFKYGHVDVEGYTDVVWAGSVIGMHSTFRYFTFVGCYLVTQSSKKTKVVWLGQVWKPSFLACQNGYVNCFG